MSVSTAFPGPAGSAGTAAAGLALDARSLASLRKAAATDPEASAKEAASQFEALFMQQILKSMRAAMPKSGMLDGPGSEMYTSLLDTQLAQAMSGAPGGLADLIAKQITRHMQAVQAGGGQPAATAASRIARTFSLLVRALTLQFAEPVNTVSSMTMVLSWMLPRRTAMPFSSAVCAGPPSA